jgi:hypothetical protein
VVRSIGCWRPVCKDRHHPNLETLEIDLFPHGILQKIPRSATFAAPPLGLGVPRFREFAPTIIPAQSAIRHFAGPPPVWNRGERLFLRARCRQSYPFILYSYIGAESIPRSSAPSRQSPPALNNERMEPVKRNRAPSTALKRVPMTRPTVVSVLVGRCKPALHVFEARCTHIRRFGPGLVITPSGSGVTLL